MRTNRTLPATVTASLRQNRAAGADRWTPNAAATGSATTTRARFSAATAAPSTSQAGPRRAQPPGDSSRSITDGARSPNRVGMATNETTASHSGRSTE